MLLTIKELRNRMLNCKPDAVISVTFHGDDVSLAWYWDVVGQPVQHSIIVPMDRIRADNRLFEREMHKAKRVLRKGE